MSEEYKYNLLTQELLLHGLGGEVAVVYVTFAHQVGDGFTAGVDGKFGKVDGVG